MNFYHFPRFESLREMIEDAPVVPLEIVLSSAEVFNTLEQSFDIVNARSYYMSTLAKRHNPAAATAALARIDAEFLKYALEASLMRTEIDKMALEIDMPAPVRVQAKTLLLPIATPLSRRFVALIEDADVMAGVVEGLTISERISSAERAAFFGFFGSRISGLRRTIDSEWKSLFDAEEARGS